LISYFFLLPGDNGHRGIAEDIAIQTIFLQSTIAGSELLPARYFRVSKPCTVLPHFRRAVFNFPAGSLGGAYADRRHLLSSFLLPTDVHSAKDVNYDDHHQNGHTEAQQKSGKDRKSG
jgi:hypothetical protein